MKKYTLLVLGMGNYDKTRFITCTDMQIRGGCYSFYNVENDTTKKVFQHITDIAYYPVHCTIIERIEEVEN